MTSGATGKGDGGRRCSIPGIGAINRKSCGPLLTVSKHIAVPMPEWHGWRGVGAGVGTEGGIGRWRVVGFGTRGDLPCMMSSTCSRRASPTRAASVRHHLDLVAVVFDQLAAQPYCSSIMRRISRSTFCMVASDTFFCVAIERPRNTSPSFSRVHHRPQRIRHAVTRDHVARHLRRALEVVAGAGGHLVHEDLFGDAPAEQHGDALQQVVAIDRNSGLPRAVAWSRPARAHAG